MLILLERLWTLKLWTTSEGFESQRFKDQVLISLTPVTQRKTQLFLALLEIAVTISLHLLCPSFSFLHKLTPPNRTILPCGLSSHHPNTFSHILLNHLPNQLTRHQLDQTAQNNTSLCFSEPLYWCWCFTEPPEKNLHGRTGSRTGRREEHELHNTAGNAICLRAHMFVGNHVCCSFTYFLFSHLLPRSS